MKREWQPNFSHIYIERDCLNSDITKTVIERFKRATIVEIDDYKSVFNRPGQRFQLQKQSMKLIIANKREPLIYDGSPFAPAFGHPNFFYNTPIVNCVYNCDYCYLQGMYRSANMIIYANQDEMAAAADQVLKERGSIYLCVSYDTDLLAFENVVPLSRYWINWATQRDGALVELRTKSANYKAIADLPVSDHTVIAWTLSPTDIARDHESKTASTKLRIDAMTNALNDGRKVRLCIDPILKVDDWQQKYGALIDQLSEKMDLNALHDASLGTFRMNKDYLKNIQKQRTDSAILYHPFDESDGCAVYASDTHKELISFVGSKLAQQAPNLPINYFSI